MVSSPGCQPGGRGFESVGTATNATNAPGASCAGGVRVSGTAGGIPVPRGASEASPRRVDGGARSGSSSEGRGVPQVGGGHERSTPGPVSEAAAPDDAGLDRCHLARPARAAVSALERTAAVLVKLADGSPYLLGGSNGELYFELGSQLWKTDGTPTGTMFLSTATPRGPHHDQIAGIVCHPFCPSHFPEGASANGLFFLAADDGVHGFELWTSNGTPAGTFMVQDIGADSFDPFLVTVGGLVFFTRGARRVLLNASSGEAMGARRARSLSPPSRRGRWSGPM